MEDTIREREFLCLYGRFSAFFFLKNPFKSKNPKFCKNLYFLTYKDKNSVIGKLKTE